MFYAVKHTEIIKWKLVQVILVIKCLMCSTLEMQTSSSPSTITFLFKWWRHTVKRYKLTFGILPPGCQQEVLDFFNLVRLRWVKKQRRGSEHWERQSWQTASAAESIVRGPVELRFLGRIETQHLVHHCSCKTECITSTTSLRWLDVLLTAEAASCFSR